MCCAMRRLSESGWCQALAFTKTAGCNCDLLATASAVCSVQRDPSRIPAFGLARPCHGCRLRGTSCCTSCRREMTCLMKMSSRALLARKGKRPMLMHMRSRNMWTCRCPMAIASVFVHAQRRVRMFRCCWSRRLWRWSSLTSPVLPSRSRRRLATMFAVASSGSGKKANPRMTKTQRTKWTLWVLQPLEFCCSVLSADAVAGLCCFDQCRAAAFGLFLSVPSAKAVLGL